jgi:fermentation-respiration switch protein FrsA (DUF1100 family)
MGTLSLLLLLLVSGPRDTLQQKMNLGTPPFGTDQEGLLGTWAGTLVVSGAELPVVFHIRAAEDGRLTATMDSPAQGATDIPVNEVFFSEGHLRMVSAAVGGAFEGDLAPDGARFEGKWVQSGMELPLTLERTEEGLEAPSRPQDPQPPFPYGEEEVRILNSEGGHTLAGTLTLPEGDGPFPAVVLVSGSGPQDRDEAVFGHRPFLILADHLARKGIAVLRYDDRGVGASEGDFGSATSEDFVSDALAGVSLLRNRMEIDPDHVGILGHSEGGLVAPLAAVRSADVSFVVMLAGPGVTGEEILLEQGALIAQASGASDAAIRRNRDLQEELFAIVKDESDPDVARPLLEEAMRTSLGNMTEEERATAGLTRDTEEQVVESQVRSVNSPWFRFFLTHDPAPVLRRVSVPVLALFGELDLQVPPGQNLPEIEAALREGGNADATVLELPGLNHLFQTAATGSPMEYPGIEETISPAALEAISEWIRERTSGEG